MLGLFRALLDSNALEKEVYPAHILTAIEDPAYTSFCGVYYIKKLGWNNEFIIATLFSQLLASWGTSQATVLLLSILRDAPNSQDGFNVARFGKMLKAVSEADRLAAGLVMRETQKKAACVYGATGNRN